MKLRDAEQVISEIVSNLRNNEETIITKLTLNIW